MPKTVNVVFTVEEAVERIKNGDFDDAALYPDGFELPDVYGDDWTIKTGAGAFGRKFFNYVADNPDLGIRYIGKGPRRARYKYHK